MSPIEYRTVGEDDVDYIVIHFDRLKPCTKDMRVGELMQGQVISLTLCETEAGLVRKQIISLTIHDSEDNHS